MKKIIGFLSLVLLSAIFLSCATPPAPEPAPEPVVSQPTPAPAPAPAPAPTPEPAVSQPTPAPAPTPVVEELVPVYDEYEGDLILEGATRYLVKQGDTLSEISAATYGYGRGIYFPIIMLASRSLVQDPDLIEPGMNLTIPDLQRNLDNQNTRERIKSYLLEIAAVYARRAKPGYSAELQQAANSTPISLQR
jgi:nucleoid-associated protein YgaU